jgi:epoxyqueuosine reductase
VPVSPSDVSRRVKELATEAGFDQVGIATLVPLRAGLEGERLERWIEEGRQGSMEYMARGLERRLEPGQVLAGAKSVVCVALNYGEPGDAGAADPAGAVPRGVGKIARYARGRDYHKVFTRRLKVLESRLSEAFPGIGTRRYVDTGPVMEKLWAERAGLGWRGKHTNLVSREWGSWLLLGEVLLDLELESADAGEDYCGECTRCIDVCPTGAITGPYQLDARLCVSYLTIEHRGAIPKELRRGIGDRVFGCDDCLDVCPWNRFAQDAREADFTPRDGMATPALAELVALDDGAFLERFAGTAVMRAKREGLARNACIALGNSGDEDAVGALVIAMRDPSALVREHAAWALGQIGGEKALEALRRSAMGETSAEVLNSIHEGLEKGDGLPG